MNVVEKEAKKFHSSSGDNGFYGGLKIHNLENLYSKLSSKLYNFSRDRDKLDFLKILLQESVRTKEEHMKTCKRNGCDFEEIRDIGIFVIEQEIDRINKFYKYKPLSDDEFTSEEESILHCKLNEIIEEIKKMVLGRR